MYKVKSNIFRTDFKDKLNELVKERKLECFIIDYYPQDMELSLQFKSVDSSISDIVKLQISINIEYFVKGHMVKINDCVLIDTHGNMLSYNDIYDTIDDINKFLILDKNELDIGKEIYEITQRDDGVIVYDDAVTEYITSLDVECYVMYENVPFYKLVGETTELISCERMIMGVMELKKKEE